MTDKMPAEIWATYGAFNIDWWQETPDDELTRYIHEFHYKRLLEAYRKNRELLADEHHDPSCASLRRGLSQGGWPPDPCDCWKSEIEEVEGV